MKRSQIKCMKQMTSQVITKKYTILRGKIAENGNICEQEATQ